MDEKISNNNKSLSVVKTMNVKEANEGIIAKDVFAENANRIDAEKVVVEGVSGDIYAEKLEVTPLVCPLFSKSKFDELKNYEEKRKSVLNCPPPLFGSIKHMTDEVIIGLRPFLDELLDNKFKDYAKDLENYEREQVKGYCDALKELIDAGEADDAIKARYETMNNMFRIKLFDAYIKLGDFSLEDKDIDTAREYFTNAVTLYPERSPLPYYEIGNILYEEKDRHSAWEWIERAEDIFKDAGTPNDKKYIDLEGVGQLNALKENIEKDWKRGKDARDKAIKKIKKVIKYSEKKPDANLSPGKIKEHYLTPLKKIRELIETSIDLDVDPNDFNEYYTQLGDIPLNASLDYAEGFVNEGTHWERKELEYTKSNSELNYKLKSLEDHLGKAIEPPKGIKSRLKISLGKLYRSLFTGGIIGGIIGFAKASSSNWSDISLDITEGALFGSLAYNLWDARPQKNYYDHLISLTDLTWNTKHPLLSFYNKFGIGGTTGAAVSMVPAINSGLEAIVNYNNDAVTGGIGTIIGGLVNLGIYSYLKFLPKRKK